MRNVIYSCLSKSDPYYVDYLRIFEEEADNYKKQFKIDGVLSDVERKFMDFIIKSYEVSGETPSLDLFVKMFSEYPVEDDLRVAEEIGINDFRVYIFNLIDKRVNKYIANRLDELNAKVKSDGITDDIAQEFTKLTSLSNRNKAKDINIEIDSKQEYDNKKLRPVGLVTGIPEVDDKIGGMSPGTVTTIAGFTSQYKTTMSLNIAHLNAYELGYNICYLSLETPKEDINWNLLSCHSYSTKFKRYNFVSHAKMRWGTMTADEEDFIFNEVEPDLKNDYIDDEGNTRKRGKVIILDESDFKTFSFGEISSVIEKVDDKLGGKLDCVIVDYIQLCKFSGQGVTYDANSQINSYVTFFRRLAQNFKKEIKEDGTEEVRQLTMILLAQINRSSWQKASRNDGRYDITCLADANELERGSARVFTTYTSEDLKARKSAQVQILKNRAGQTMYDPVTVYADGEAYVFMSEDGMNSSFGGDGLASVESAFASMDDSFDFL